MPLEAPGSPPDLPTLPFSQRPQIGADEEVGLRALFEKVFYGVDFSPSAVEALSRFRFLPGGAPRGQGPPGERSPEGTHYILLNRGETGIGKTRVFRQFRLTAAERRIPVYEIHCYDVEGIPFKPFLHVIREILRDFELSQFLREKYRYALESLLPEIYRDGPRAGAMGVAAGGAPLGAAGADLGKAWAEERAYGSPAGGSEAEMVRIFDALTQLLFEVTALKPVVILVHDLHWGDRGTIELLRYIGRNLQLRNSRIAAASAPRGRREVRGSLPRPRGPESGDDEGEWRELTTRSARALEPQSAPQPATASGEKVLPEPSEGFEDRPVRLMVLANYCGFPDSGHYLERAIRSLGEEPFAFHGEIRTLSREESARFIERSLAESPSGSPRVACDGEAVDLIHRLSEGFPSYVHELLRLVFLPSSKGRDSTGMRAGVPDRIEGPLIRGLLGEPEAAPPGKAPAHPRLLILARRLETVSEEERAVLDVLALARKPLPAEFLTRVLHRDRQKLCEVEKLLADLEARFFIERVRHEYPRRGEETGYYFRIADYAFVAAERTPAESRRSLHQRIGEECRELMAEEGNEKAYEVFHHLRRGDDPSSSVSFGIAAVQRLLRSFSLEKAVQVCDDILDVCPPRSPRGDGGVCPPRSPRGDGGVSSPPSPRGDGSPPPAAPAPAAESPRRLRPEVLLRKAELHLALREHSKAEAALGQLLEEEASSLPDKDRLEVLLRQAEVARAAGDPARTMKILSKAFRLLKDENHSAAVRLHAAMAGAYLDRQDGKRAINFCLNGLKILKHKPEAEENPDLYLILARAHSLRGDDSHAVDNFQRALECVERRKGHKAAAAGILDDLGKVYLERGNYFRAARYLYKSLEFKRREQDILGLSRSYDELGRVYLRTGDEIKTIEHLNRSLALKERVGDLAGLNPTLAIIGDLYFRLGQYQRAIRYFKREVDSSQLRSDTRGLVEAFLHLGWVYFELGELKQVESLCRQVSILAGEFKLRAPEAEGARLWAALEGLERNWSGAEKHLRQAIEVHSKLGDRRREAESLLGLAEIKFNRELYDESLKLASKGQVIAEGLKAVDLQAHAHLVKGNVYRFLKGGSAEKAKDLLRRALELGQPLNDARLLFEIFYSLAKVYHYDSEFAEAGNYYGKAEAILRRVADGLPEDMAARFLEDRRRKLFFEDSARFRKEVQNRTPSGGAIELSERPAAVDLREKPLGLPDYKDLVARLLKVHGSIQEIDFCDRLLSEGVELVKAERGIILRVQSRQYAAAAARGFGADPEGHPEYPTAQSLAEEAVRRGRPLLCAGPEDEEKLGKLLRLSGPIRRAVLAVPLLTAERVFGALYVDRPLSLGRFSSRDLMMAETLAAHAGSAFENRRQYEAAIKEPLTGFYTPTYFLERLKDAYRWYNLHGRSFFLLGFYLPSLEESIGGGGGDGGIGAEKVARELATVLPRGAAASWWNPILSILLFDADLATVEAAQARIAERLGALFKDEIDRGLLAPEARFTDGATLYNELRRTLLPEECDPQTMTEIRRLLARDITLKEAKRILEKHIIESTLRKTGGNITHAAKELGIHRPQLSNLLKKYALKRELYERNFDIRLNPLDN